MTKIIIGLGALLVIAGCGGPGVDKSETLIVIDAGHGGHDSGAVCAGSQEKDIVLKITKKLYKEFKSEGYRVHLTRSSDKFLKLGQRTRIADHKDAKVFISIHANASVKKRARGWNVFFLAPAKNDSARSVAQFENSFFLKEFCAGFL